MLINNYAVIDNIFDQPQKVLSYAKKCSYRSNLVKKKNLPGLLASNNQIYEDSMWRGYRSYNLGELNDEDCKIIINELFYKLFGFEKNVGFNIIYDAFFHYSTKDILYDQNWWHTDESYLSGVVYLNKNASINTGTILKIDNKDVEIQNVFNRCLIYKANILHRPSKCFGDSADNARLTLTFFIKQLNMYYAY